ncbi:MAG: hypothetical protein IKK09_01580 [Clostridia bacterium]|nr:hypothetical protein [Clostridia bacterium]
MPIKNYTTKVDVYTTIGAIQGCLVKHGARQIMQNYDDNGEPQALCFSIETPFGMRGVRLPANVEAVQRVLLQQKVKCDKVQAARVAWRIVKDWVEAQMAILESEMVGMDEIFLPYMLNSAGNTVYELYSKNQLMLEG